MSWCTNTEWCIRMAASMFGFGNTLVPAPVIGRVWGAYGVFAPFIPVPPAVWSCGNSGL